jgi:hypothetical protein
VSTLISQSNNLLNKLWFFLHELIAFHEQASRALSCLRISVHNFLVKRLRHNRNRRRYEIRTCEDSPACFRTFLNQASVYGVASTSGG